MHGIILAYSSAANAGVIKAADGRTFYFTAADWRETASPRANTIVLFRPGLKTAHDVKISADQINLLTAAGGREVKSGGRDLKLSWSESLSIYR